MRSIKLNITNVNVSALYELVEEAINDEVEFTITNTGHTAVIDSITVSRKNGVSIEVDTTWEGDLHCCAAS